MSTVQQALETLAHAHGSKALATAFHRLTGTVTTVRRKARQAVGELAATYVAAMKIWDAMKAEGLSQEHRVAALDKSLRAAWPQTREWKYLCDRCDDYGLQMRTCPGDATCGRLKPHNPHDYGEPCWCQAGKRFRPTTSDPQDFTQAGKRAKPKPTGFSQVGR